MNDLLEEKLKRRSIKPTAMRLLVLKTLLEENQALSLNEIESKLGNVDKSTIFRSLKTFQEKFLVHRIYDGTGLVKFAVCEDDCNCSLDDNHVHFLCTKCSKTYCFKDANVVKPEIPKGFLPNYANFLIEGICKNCA